MPKKSLRSIAELLGRAPSTVSREVNRNSDAIGYLPPKMTYDRQKAKRGRRKSKIDKNPALKNYIINKLNKTSAL